MSGAIPKLNVIQGGLSQTDTTTQPNNALLLAGGFAGGGGGPHDPGIEARMVSVEAAVVRLEGRIDSFDARLRGVETSLARVEGKIDALTSTIVGQTSAALAKLPNWWQMPAVVASTMLLVLATLAAAKYFQAHGLL
jgi:hypothetical protein